MDALREVVPVAMMLRSRSARQFLRTGTALLGSVLLLWSALILAAAPVLAAAPRGHRLGHRPGPPPNILLFISDDHGWTDYGFLGHPFVETPNIDRLASEGAVFRNGYAQASICLPALRTLISGLPSPVWTELVTELAEIHGPSARRRQSEHVTVMLPKMLRKAGYTSFAGGKMWEGTFGDAGFDAGTMDVIPTFGVDGADQFGRESMEPLFDWLDTQSGPWFAWVAPMLPHHPHDPPADLLAIYEDVDITDEARLYFANLSRMDRRLGEVIAYLELANELDDTLVIYLADNGWEQRLTEPTPLDNVLGDDRGKASMYDAGFHTPIIVRWPREVRHARTLKPIVDFEDVYTTILDYAGVETHACTVGKSFRRNARSRHSSRRRNGGRFFATADVQRIPLAELEEGELPFRLEPGRFLRTRSFAYTHFPERNQEFVYALRTDPAARNDISADSPLLVSFLRLIANLEQQRLEERHCTVEMIEPGSG